MTKPSSWLGTLFGPRLLTPDNSVHGSQQLLPHHYHRTAASAVLTGSGSYHEAPAASALDWGSGSVLTKATGQLKRQPSSRQSSVAAAGPGGRHGGSSGSSGSVETSVSVDNFMSMGGQASRKSVSGGGDPLEQQAVAPHSSLDRPGGMAQLAGCQVQRSASAQFCGSKQGGQRQAARARESRQVEIPRNLSERDLAVLASSLPASFGGYRGGPGVCVWGGGRAVVRQAGGA